MPSKNIEKHYVLGFALIDADTPDKMVCLIHKSRPIWQKGMLNAIGGHVEHGESPADAMRREAYEEVGLPENTNWVQFGEMLLRDVRIDVFYAKVSINDISTYQRDPEEYHIILPVDTVPTYGKLAPHLLPFLYTAAYGAPEENWLIIETVTP